MRTLKADLQAANKRLEQQNTMLELALYDLVTKPESVIWIEAGKPGSDSWVSWGLVRIRGAAGGYVIRRHGPKFVSAIETLDSLAARLPEHLNILASDPPFNAQVVNERQVLTQVLATRRQLVGAEENKWLETVPQLSNRDRAVKTDLAINPTGKTP